MTYSEITTLSNLPAEIVQQVAIYLNTKDLAECTCVSNSWNSIFRNFRHWSVKLTTSWQFSDFLKALERYTRTTKRRKLDYTIPRVDNLGDYIYKLHLEDGIMSVQDMKQLAAMCPNITSVHFNWKDNGMMSRTRRSLPGHQFHSPVPFFQHFHPASLIALDLNGPVSQLSADTISSVLRRLPQLESLTLSLDVFEAAPATVEHFHDACPNLKHLKIGRVSPPDDDYTIPFDITVVVPAYTMQSLSFPDAVSDDGNFCDGQWFLYIKRKYPSLTSLSIFSGGVFKGPLGRQRVEAPPYVSAIVLRDHFPHLTTLDLGMFAGSPSSAYPQLFKNVPNVSLFWDEPAIHFKEWIQSDAINDLVQLTLRTLPKVLDGIMHCVHLRELTLGKKSAYLDAFQELPLDIVLSCPVLEKLSISCCFIRHTNRTMTSQSCLKTLLIDTSAFDNNQVSVYIGERCRQLTHVSLHHCLWRSTEPYPVIHLYFPYQWFTFFCLRDPKVYSSATSRDLYLVQPTQFPPYTHTRWRASSVTGMNECFMLNTLEQEESDLPLFWIKETKSHPKTTVTRIKDTRIIHYLNESQDAAKVRKTKEPMALLRKSDNKQLLVNRWSTVLYCRGVYRFHYNSGRVSMDCKDFIAVR